MLRKLLGTLLLIYSVDSAQIFSDMVNGRRLAPMYPHHTIRSSTGCTNPRAIASDPVPDRPHRILVLCQNGLFTSYSRLAYFKAVAKQYKVGTSKNAISGSQMVVHFKANVAIVHNNCHIVIVNIWSVSSLNFGTLPVTNPGCSSPDTVGSFSNTRLQRIRTITSGGNNDIYVQTVTSVDYLIRLDFAGSVSEKINFITSSNGFNLAFNLQEQSLVAWAEEGIFKYHIPTQTTTKLADVNYGGSFEDGLIADAVFVEQPPGCRMDATFTDTIFYCESNGTVRVLDLNTMNVTSICTPSGSTSHSMGFASTCKFPTIIDMHMMPEFHTLYVLSDAAIIYMIYVKPAYESCQEDSDCTQLCNGEQFEDFCAGKTVCDKYNNFCTIPCEADSQCPILYSCEDRNPGPNMCIIKCEEHSDCPSNGLCVREKFCDEPECYHDADFCSGCICYFLLHKPYTTRAHLENDCSISVWFSYAMIPDSVDELDMLLNNYQMTSGNLWTSAVVSNGMAHYSIPQDRGGADLALTEVPEESPLYSTTRWVNEPDMAGIFYDLNTGTWYTANWTETADTDSWVICEHHNWPSGHVWNPMLEFEHGDADDCWFYGTWECHKFNLALATDDCLSNDCNYVKPIWPSKIISRVGIVETLTATKTPHCCEPSSDNFTINADLSNIIQSHQYKNGSTSCPDSDVTVPRTSGVCTDGVWQLDYCSLQVAACGYPPLPKFAIMEADSLEFDNTRYGLDDMVIFSCSTSELFYNSFAITCSETGWMPDISATAPQTCNPTTRILTLFHYYNITNLCYGRVEALNKDLDYEGAELLCSIAYQGDIAMLTPVIIQALGENIVNSDGKADPMPEYWLRTSDPEDCITLVGSDITHRNCSIDEGVIHGVICEIWTQPIVGWTFWTEWSICDVSLRRERTRTCGAPDGECVICEGPAIEIQSCCTDPGFGNHSVRFFNDTSFGESTLLFYDCEAGHSSDTYSRYEILTCNHDNTWNSTVLTCYPRECDFFELKNGSGSTLMAYPNVQYFVDTYVFRECELYGFVLDGLFTPRQKIMCGGNGKWVDDVYTDCIPISCGPVPRFSGGVITGRSINPFNFDRVEGFLYFEDQIHISCDPGYQYKKEKTFTVFCKADGTLSESNYTCEEVFCDEAPSIRPSNTFIDERNFPVITGKEANLSCVRQYAVNKNISFTSQPVTCIEYSHWNLSNTLPCEPVICSYPGEGSDVAVQPENKTYLIYDLATYICRTGYADNNTGHGISSIECGDKNVWLGEPADCQKVRCPEPPRLEHGSMNISGMTYLSTVTYTCDFGYFIAGSYSLTGGEQVLECTARSVWSGVPVPCVRLTAYHSVKLEKVKTDGIVISLIQRTYYNETAVNYTIIFKGVGNDLDTITVYYNFTNDKAGYMVHHIPLPYGFRYELWVHIRLIDIDGEPFETLYREDSVPLFYLPTREPSIINGTINLDRTVPSIRTVMIEEFRKKVDVQVALPFTTNHGVIRAFSLIICEINPFIDPQYYDAKLYENLPSYRDMLSTLKDFYYWERADWNCYQPISKCMVNFTNPDLSSCGFRDQSFGTVDDVKYVKAWYTIGSQRLWNCKSSSDIYCNGPLKPGSKFCVRTRVETDDDYFDSPCSERFSTGYVWEWTFPAGMSFVMILPYLVLAGFIYHTLQPEPSPAEAMLGLDEYKLAFTVTDQKAVLYRDLGDGELEYVTIEYQTDGTTAPTKESYLPAARVPSVMNDYRQPSTIEIKQTPTVIFVKRSKASVVYDRKSSVIYDKMASVLFNLKPSLINDDKGSVLFTGKRSVIDGDNKSVMIKVERIKSTMLENQLVTPANPVTKGKKGKPAPKKKIAKASNMPMAGKGALQPTAKPPPRKPPAKRPPAPAPASPPPPAYDDDRDLEPIAIFWGKQ